MAVRLSELSRWGRSGVALPRPSLDVALFALALAVFLVTRLIGLGSFPISFLSDEAVQAVDAANLVDLDFRDQSGHLLPTYLPNGPYTNLGVSVYLQVIPHSLVGFSVVAARGVTVVVAFSAMVAFGLTLRDVFRARFWWAGVLLLSAAPAWFLHSRTALETALATSFYAWALYLYLRFRTGGSPRTLYAAVVLAALAFYSYRASQLVILVTALLLVLSDARFLWHRRAALARAAALAAVLAVPQIRFQLQMPEDTVQQLRNLGSYWADPALSVTDKLQRFGREYLAGLDPRYWYDPGQSTDLRRHFMRGYGNLLLVTLPFAVLGLAACLTRLRWAPARALVLALAAAPVGAALVGLSVTRALIFVVPASLLAALGLSLVLSWLAERMRYVQVAVTAFVLLVAVNGVMLWDSLARAGTWYRDYGLYGLQYGGRQVTDEIREYLRTRPETQVVLSPTWANGTDTIARFFLPDEPRVILGSIDAFMVDVLDPRNMLFVMTPDEYARARASPKFSNIQVERTVEYPDGRDGFYFVRLDYSASAAAIIAAEREERTRPVTETLTVDKRPVIATYSPFDRGRIEDLFDGDTFTLARTLEANPAEIRLRFDRPRALSGVEVVAAGEARELEVEVALAGEADTAVFFEADTSAGEPSFAVRFGAAPGLVRELVLRLRDATVSGPTHVHIREIELQ